jgi:hypothetical protein
MAIQLEGLPMMKRLLTAVVALVSVCVLASPAAAQASRTWVSGVGDDVNPCSRTAPCKTFAGAISKTAANGEISVLDPGGFGAVTITKSISIVADGNEGGILASLTNGITINSATAVVYIRGLIIEGRGDGLNGVNIVAAKNVVIENSVIRGFRAAGPANGAAVKAAGTAKVTIVRSTLSDNRVAVKADTFGTEVYIRGSTITGNAVVIESTAFVRSYGDNAINHNVADGTVLPKVPLE